MGRELKRVPLDFDHPIGEVWSGFVNPHYAARKCEACDGSGYSPRAKLFHSQWYGYVLLDASAVSESFAVDHPAIQAAARRNVNNAPDFYGTGDTAIQREANRLMLHFNSSWSHRLIQADVDALVAAERLMDFTHTWKRGDGWKPKDPPYRPTAEEVNEWSLQGFGHDSINCSVCIEARCKREGVDCLCPECRGNGGIWPSEEAKRIYEEWKKTEPPTGDGYQIWETVSEGSPVSPVFATPEELARWMVANDDSVTKDTTYDQWVAWIRGPGCAPSMVVCDGIVEDGVVASLH